MQIKITNVIQLSHPDWQVKDWYYYMFYNMYENIRDEKPYLIHTYTEKGLTKVNQLGVASEVTTGFGFWSKRTLVYLY